MPLNVNWNNPYANRKGHWYKGNLHTHTSEGSSCGTLPPDRVLQLYLEKNYDFLAISDHMFLSRQKHTGMVLIAGTEWNSENGEHTGIYSCNRDLLTKVIEDHNHDSILQHLSGSDALVVLNHPNWQPVSHYRREQLDKKQFFDGVEIYNAVIERLAGYAISTDKWDYLLAQDRRVLGFAVDDSHTESDIGQGWIMVRASKRTPEAILKAMQEGNFYCSSGVAFSDIQRDGDMIHVETEDAEEIQVIATGGRRILKVSGASLHFDVSDLTHSYVRFTAYGRGSTMAWTQPFFMT